MAHWQPLKPATIIRDQKRLDALIRDGRRLHAGPEPFDEAALRAGIEAELRTPIFKNWQYQVARKEQDTGQTREDGRAGTAKLVHLSIKRLDQKPARDWRDLQRIKNELLGPGCEAVELFPSEERLVDLANQTHLWGFDDPTFRFPFGFKTRAVDDIPDAETGAKQRKFSRP